MLRLFPSRPGLIALSLLFGGTVAQAQEQPPSALPPPETRSAENTARTRQNARPAGSMVKALTPAAEAKLREQLQQALGSDSSKKKQDESIDQIITGLKGLFGDVSVKQENGGLKIRGSNINVDIGEIKVRPPETPTPPAPPPAAARPQPKQEKQTFFMVPPRELSPGNAQTQTSADGSGQLTEIPPPSPDEIGPPIEWVP